MKTVTVRDLQKRVKDCVDDAQDDRIIITRRGRPAAVLIGVEDKDWDAVVLQTDPAFWKLIRTRRRQSTLSIDEIREKIGAPRQANRRAQSRRLPKS
jgi:prevent-host-death family protein